MTSANGSPKRGDDPQTFHRALSIRNDTIMKLSQFARTSLAVLALSAGIVGTTLPTAAFAAETGGIIHKPQAPRAPKPPEPPRTPDDNQILPDVSVATMGHSGDPYIDTFTVIEFDLQTTKADANGITVSGACTYGSKYDFTTKRNEAIPSKQMSLSASWPQPIPFLVTCAPKTGEYVSSAFLLVTVPGGDSDLSNNTNSWDIKTGK